MTNRPHTTPRLSMTASESEPPDLCIGVAKRQSCLSLFTLMPGRRSIEANFVATAMSAEAVRIYLDDHDGRVRLAVDGLLIDLALRCACNTLVATTLVASSEPSAESLAVYASNAL